VSDYNRVLPGDDLDAHALEAHRRCCTTGCTPSVLCSGGRELLAAATRTATRTLVSSTVARPRVLA
jgi:hypothetical protein